jgi:hypothetical protein
MFKVLDTRSGSRVHIRVGNPKPYKESTVEY